MKLYYQKNKVTPPLYGRRYAIGDIHGCYRTFRTLIKNKIELTREDHLYLLGDYINKGPDSKKTLNYIIKLIEKGYQVFPLRGNHEQELLDSIKDEPQILNWFLRKSTGFLKDGKMKIKYVNFLNTLPYYYELPDFYLVHASFNFNHKNPLKDKNSMLWRGVQEKKTNFGGDKLIIHAHQPQNLKKIKKKVFNRNKIIGLDNGVNIKKKNDRIDYQEFGNLCALNLDNFELIIQPNVESLSKAKLRKSNQKIA